MRRRTPKQCDMLSRPPESYLPRWGGVSSPGHTDPWVGVCCQLMDLYESGQCDLLCTDQYGMTALHHAARFGHKHIVKFLIKHGR